MEIKANIEEVNKKMEVLQQENEQLKYKLKSIEVNQRKKNLVVFGVKETGHEQGLETYETVYKLCWERLNLDVSDGQIEEAYRIGKGMNRPILIKCRNLLTKERILNKRRNLRNSKIRLEFDYDYEIRCRRRLLLPFMWAARHNNHFARLYHDKLKINNELFNLEFCLENLNSTDLETGDMEKKRNELKTEIRKLIEKQTERERMGGLVRSEDNGRDEGASRDTSHNLLIADEQEVETRGSERMLVSAKSNAVNDIDRQLEGWEHMLTSTTKPVTGGNQGQRTIVRNNNRVKTRQLKAGATSKKCEKNKVSELGKQKRHLQSTRRGSEEDGSVPSTSGVLTRGNQGQKNYYSLRNWCLRKESTKRKSKNNDAGDKGISSDSEEK